MPLRSLRIGRCLGFLAIFLLLLVTPLVKRPISGRAAVPPAAGLRGNADTEPENSAALAVSAENITADFRIRMRKPPNIRHLAARTLSAALLIAMNRREIIDLTQIDRPPDASLKVEWAPRARPAS